MKQIAPAIIVAIGLIVGGFLAGGRYTIVHSQLNEIVRLDRFTGQVAMCVPGTRAPCEWMLDPPAPDEIDNMMANAANQATNSN